MAGASILFKWKHQTKTKMDKWISVNKKLPRSGKPVLVFSPEAISTAGHLIGTYWNKKDSGGSPNWTAMDGEFQDRRIVTHWMKLPPKP